MIPAELPPVEGGALLMEDDPEYLNAYARGLWNHLKTIRAGGPADGYPIRTIRAAALWLMDRYSEAEIAPDYEAVRLIRDLLDPKGDAAETSTSPVPEGSQNAYWAAIAFEAAQSSQPSLYAVAKHVRQEGGFPKQVAGKRAGLSAASAGAAAQKSAEATIRTWRKLDHYTSNVDLRRAIAHPVPSATVKS